MLSAAVPIGTFNTFPAELAPGYILMPSDDKICSFPSNLRIHCINLTGKKMGELRLSRNHIVMEYEMSMK